MAAPSAPKLDPNALINKHAATTGVNAPTAEATVKRIETQIANSPMGWLQSKFAEVDSRAKSEEGAVKGKIQENEKAVSENQKSAPKDAGPPPKPGNPTKAAVSTPSKATTQKTSVKASSTKTGGGTPAATSAVSTKTLPTQSVQSAAAAPESATPVTIAQAVAGAQSDGQLDELLNGYQPRSPQAKEMLDRITQMRTVADGFHGQLDTYIASGGALQTVLASVGNAFNAGTQARAIWASNPYRKMGGLLGGIMTGMSAVQNVTGLVGSICGKLGMILTVIGLLGMIFPPIGAAVSGIARVLNVIGLICDAISFVLSGVLTGLNGVVLARQIAAGATAEEKAATADLLITEANNTAGGLINVAMAYGPKFYKGLSTASKGVLGSLVRRFKSVVTKVTLKLTGPIKNFTNRIVRKMGFGGAKMDRVGGKWTETQNFVQKAATNVKKKFVESKTGKKLINAYQAPAKKIDAWQDSLMSKYGTSKFAKSMDRIGARTGAWADKWDPLNATERLGSKVGNWGSKTNFAKSSTAIAETAEKETRELAAKFARQDAVHLEETRWRNYLKDRNEKRGEKGGIPTSDATAQKFIQSRGDKVGTQLDKDFAKSESTLAYNNGVQKKMEMDDHAQSWRDDKNYRDARMRDLHASRDQRWSLEVKYKDKDEARKALLLVEKRTPAQNDELAGLNLELADLDKRRSINLELEGRQQGLTGHRRREVHNAHDLYENFESATGPLQDFLELRIQASWRKGSLSKMHKWDRGAASAGSLKAGGHSTYSAIKEAKWRSESEAFAAFVALGRPTPTVAATVRGMLSSVDRIGSKSSSSTTSSVSSTSSSTTSSTTSSTSSSTSTTSSSKSSSTTSSSSSSSSTSSSSSSSSTSTKDETPQQATNMPDPVPDTGGGTGGDDGAADAIPYWPALIPEFDKAMGDFAYMRTVATEFKKAQITGKQKSVDTLATYGRYQEYAKLRAEQSKQNQTDAQSTQQETKTNNTQAGEGANKAGQGAAKQNEAKGAASNRAAVDIPEPETSGFWGRILGAIKRWAKSKAQQVFGWIQEQVASLVLKGLCGVSMGDMREYANALRTQQNAASGVAGTAMTTSGQAEQKSIKLGADASKEAQSAADAIGECDKNIVEADAFMADVTSFEQQLTQEKAHAETFLATVRASVHAEQQRRQQEEQQRAAQQARQAQNARQLGMVDDDDDGGGQQDVDADEGDASSSAFADGDGDGVPDNAEAEAAQGQIRAAANYVSDTVGQQKVEVQGRARDYQNELHMAMTNRTGNDAAGNEVANRTWFGKRAQLSGPSEQAANKVLADFDAFVQSTRENMEDVRSMTIDPSSAGQIAEQVIQAATRVDTTYLETLDKLDQIYEGVYTALRSGEKDMSTQIMGDGTMLGDLNDDATEAGMGAVGTTTQALNVPMDAAGGAGKWAWNNTIGALTGTAEPEEPAQPVAPPAPAAAPSGNP